MSRHKKLYVSGVLMAFALFAVCKVGLAGMFGVPHVMAAVQDTLAGGIPSAVLTILGFVVSFLSFFSWICFAVLTYLLDPMFIFNVDAQGGSPILVQLQSIWQLSRDLMNVIFALMLIAAAIYTIVTAKKELVAEHWQK